MNHIMKKQLLTFIAITVITFVSYAQNTGIGTTTPDASAKLEISSPDKGFLPPRVADIHQIVNPSEGLMIYDISKKCMRYYNSYVWSDCMGGIDYFIPIDCGVTTAVVEVTNAAGDIWMDRNLGASQQATSSTDALSYGDLYQWGRFSDGHQCRTSSTTTTLATTSFPNTGAVWDGLFILQPDPPIDWLTSQDDGLWQGGVEDCNTPCPAGFRVPTKTDFTNEGLNWSSVDAAGAFASPLKFSLSEERDRATGTIVTSVSGYWSSTQGPPSSPETVYVLIIDNANTGINNWRGRANGYAVRCIKD